MPKAKKTNNRASHVPNYEEFGFKVSLCIMGLFFILFKKKTTPNGIGGFQQGYKMVVLDST